MAVPQADMKKKTLLSWSSGKDSAWTLHLLRTRADYEVVGLFTSINERHERVAMHAIRVELLKRQAEAAGLPLHIVPLPDPCTHEDYAERMGVFIAAQRAAGIECMAFGDLHLESVRQYRIDKMAGCGIEPIFPLWGTPLPTLIEAMLDAGLETYLCCVDGKQLPGELVGRRWDRELIACFPDGADPCGENGEFHSVVVDGPFFRHRVEVEIGAPQQRGDHWYVDVAPRD